MPAVFGLPIPSYGAHAQRPCHRHGPLGGARRCVAVCVGSTCLAMHVSLPCLGDSTAENLDTF